MSAAKEKKEKNITYGMHCRDHDCKPCSKMFARVESQESY
jgi:hypothetical protein